MIPRKRTHGQLPSAQFERFASIQRLGADRSGHASVEHVRYQLYVGRDKRTRAQENPADRRGTGLRAIPTPAREVFPALVAEPSRCVVTFQHLATL